MADMIEMSSDAVVTLLETADIGGTNAATGWLSMATFKRIFAYVEIGTWDAGDDLDGCRLEQAQNASGTGAKDLTSDAAAGNYDTDAPVDADGDFVILEARAEDLDVNNGFTHVRLIVSEAGNTGPDFVTAFLIRYGSRYKKEQLQGAAVAGSKVYVSPDS